MLKSKEKKENRKRKKEMSEKNMIIAPLTARGRAAVSAVRISGNGCKELFKDIFSAYKKISERKAVYGTLTLGKLKDDVIVIWYKGPNSYTGEDVAEIFCHGSSVITEAVIKTFISLGARTAERGEFTRLSFENGKMTLSQAEGVIDLIDADSENAAKAAYGLLSGKLSEKIASIREKILDLSAKINVSIDYPEEDLSEQMEMECEKECEILYKETKKLSETYESGRKAKDGVRVVITGRPNAGKSTLMNALVGYERAIVTEEEGTTRDTVDEYYIYKGMKFTVVDTAGIRFDAESKAEKLGIERSLKEVENADCVLLLDDEAMDRAGKRGIKVHTKSDIEKVGEGLKVSGKTGEGIDELKETIYRKTADIENTEAMLTNMRQYESVRECSDCLKRAMTAAGSGQPDEITAMELLGALGAIGRVDGVAATKQVTDRIFSRFCVGK